MPKRVSPIETIRAGIDLDYLFVDGSHFKMHDGTNAEPVMVAYAITTVGQPVLVAVEPAAPTLPHPSGQKRTRQNPHHQAFPAAVRCLQDDRQALTSYLRFWTEHHKRIRHTNLIKRTFRETRRRVKVIGELARTALHPSHHSPDDTATNSTDLPPWRKASIGRF